MLLLLTDLDQLGQTALQAFGLELAQSGAAAADKQDWERQAQRLEAKLEQLYAVAATMAQRETAVEDVAVIWARMVAICDRMANALSESLQGRPPRSDSYDRILDIRNACEENRALHA